MIIGFGCKFGPNLLEIFIKKCGQLDLKLKKSGPSSITNNFVRMFRNNITYSNIWTTRSEYQTHEINFGSDQNAHFIIQT